MWNVLWVGLGGFLGAGGRYLTGTAVQQWLNPAWLPVGTLTVNIVGCLVIGILGRLGESQQWLTDQMRLLLITGILGGFTTFSSLGYETLNLLRQRQIGWAIGYVGLSLALGLLAVWVGYTLVGPKGA